MERLGKEYMKAMGIENTQYVIVRHNNTAHPHCHIVFNRVDNDGKTISDKNDRYRNEKVCKQLKDKYGLTYGKGKENTNVQKLKGAEKTKYEIYHVVKDALSKTKNWQQFEHAMKHRGISIDYKYKGQTDEMQGISFKKGEHSFKGSDVDRKFSYSKLDAILNENSDQQEQQIHILKESGNTLLENMVSGAVEVASGIGGLLDFQPLASDANDVESLHPQSEDQKEEKEKTQGFWFFKQIINNLNS